MQFTVHTAKLYDHAFRAVVVLSCILLLQSCQTSEGFISARLNQQTLEIETTEGRITLTAYSPYVIESFYQIDGFKQLPSWSIATQPKLTKVKLIETATELEFSTGKIKAVIQKSPFRISYFKGEQLLIEEEQGFFANKSQRGFRFKLDNDEKLLGTGERVVGMDRRGLRLPLYNRAHYGYTTESEQMNYSLPAVMSTNKYLLLFDNTANGYIDLAKTEKNILQFESMGGRTSYIIFAGDSYPEIINHYVEVTGKQPLPPRWAFGNFASRFGYRSQQQTEDTVNKFIQEDFPVDAVILDLYWFGPNIKGYLGDLEWDKKAFPEPTKMIADFNKKGIKTVIITEPFILTNSKKWQDAVDNKVLATDNEGNPKTFDFYFGNTGLIDVFDEAANDWFWQFYAGLMEQGVEGWWGDLGEPEVHPADSVHAIGTGDEIHNVYGHKWSQMIFERQLKAYPDKRPFILMRSGFAGTQRYGILPWTGDVGRAWGGLKSQVELSLQMGLIGLGYTHSDLGGFSFIEKFDAELYLRWLQYGVFQPIYRPHADEAFPSEPIFQELWVKDILRKFIKLRYQLLPYNYSLAYQNSTTGMPLMRPLFFENEANVDLINEKDSYLWGDSFLVTPVTDANVNQVEVNAPNGVWFDFWNDKKYIGGQKLSIPVSLETIPVLVRAGAFIPMIDAISTTRDYSSESLKLHYYADKSVPYSKSMMYEDDGATYDAIAKNLFEKLHFTAEQDASTIHFNLSREGSGYSGMPTQRQMEFSVHNWLDKPQQILLSGKQLTESESLADFKIAESAVFYNQLNKQLLIKFSWDHQPVSIRIINKKQKLEKLEKLNGDKT